MSGHHPFQRLVENLPEQRKLAIEQKKKAMLAEIELREAIESSIVRDLGGELAITAKFPDMVELSIDSIKSTTD
jgi:hypothetical protein